MKLLLDTHIWVWAIQNPAKLGRRVRRHLEKTNNEVYLSPVSIWEAHHMQQRGRLRSKQGFSQWVEEALRQLPLQEAPFTFPVATAASRISLPQSDLGDMLLAATASFFDLTLVTADLQLLGCSWLKTLPNE